MLGAAIPKILLSKKWLQNYSSIGPAGSSIVWVSQILVAILARPLFWSGGGPFVSQVPTLL